MTDADDTQEQVRAEFLRLLLSGRWYDDREASVARLDQIRASGKDERQGDGYPAGTVELYGYAHMRFVSGPLGPITACGRYGDPHDAVYRLSDDHRTADCPECLRGDFRRSKPWPMRNPARRSGG